MRNYFTGTVAAGLAYLVMIEQGYRWFAHFEALNSTGPSTGGSPDFVFGDVGPGVALMEAKGTVSAKPVDFERTVRDGYLDQVEPHLGHWIGGIPATHGYSIGALMTAPDETSLSIHYTAPQWALAGPPPSGNAQPTTSRSERAAGLWDLQRENYATAFTLMAGAELGARFRSADEGVADDAGLEFLKFQWRSRRWVTGFVRPRDPRWFPRDLLGRPIGPWFMGDRETLWFAMEEAVATTALLAFLARSVRRPSFEIAAAFDDLNRRAVGDEMDGFVFPDGVAVFKGVPSRDGMAREVWRDDGWRPT